MTRCLKQSPKNESVILYRRNHVTFHGLVKAKGQCRDSRSDIISLLIPTTSKGHEFPLGLFKRSSAIYESKQAERLGQTTKD